MERIWNRHQIYWRQSQWKERMMTYNIRGKAWARPTIVSRHLAVATVLGLPDDAAAVAGR